MMVVVWKILLEFHNYLLFACEGTTPSYSEIFWGFIDFECLVDSGMYKLYICGCRMLVKDEPKRSSIVCISSAHTAVQLTVISAQGLVPEKEGKTLHHCCFYADFLGWISFNLHIRYCIKLSSWCFPILIQYSFR